jgi:hypothetical protein
MRWLLLALAVSACAPARCQVVSIDIHELAGKPKPAGVVVIGCDGRKVVIIEAEKVGQ